jgi:hypothetical protein
MAEPVELFCTSEDDGTWLVWFNHPLGGIYLLEKFDNESDARAFHKEQVDSADYSI